MGNHKVIGESLAQHPHRASRRDFLCCGGLAAGAIGLGLSMAQAGEPATGADAKDALDRLLDGNRRWVNGQSARVGRTPQDFASDADGQAPFAAIVACADSRVAPELIFDQGVGDLFVVRVAGNIVSGAGAAIKGSLEFAVAELGVKLIMVLGHSQCGAVKAAIAHVEESDAPPGAIGELVGLIQPAVAGAQGQPGDMLDNVIQANVERCVGRLKGLEPILSEFVKRGELRVIGGVYELATGVVNVIA
jgi:carbonic anhydrase